MTPMERMLVRAQEIAGMDHMELRKAVGVGPGDLIEVGLTRTLQWALAEIFKAGLP